MKNGKNKDKEFVGEVGKPLESASEKAEIGFGMVLLAVFIGFVIGLFVWAVFWASSALTQLLWVDSNNLISGLLINANIPTWWLPLAFCVSGGLIIGLWTSRVGGEPELLETVMAKVKTTGGYSLKKPGASVIGFLLPIVFGGSIGPEAGLTGIIAAACTRIGTSLKAAGIRVKLLTDTTLSAALSAIFASPFAGVVTTAEDCMNDFNPSNFQFHRRAKLVLYTASAIGATLGIALFTSIFGTESGIPRFGGVTPGINKLWWAIPCVISAYAAILIFHGSSFAFKKLGEKMGERQVLKPVIAGLVLGILAIPLPYLLFSGESQSFELMEKWTAVPGSLLIATGLLKCAMTPLCINFGWKGGHFFPIIFAGIALGYGVASIGGFNDMFCVAITTATLVAGIQRKPLMAIGTLLLCFPVESFPWFGIACLIGAYLPVPTKLLAKQAKQ